MADPAPYRIGIDDIGDAPAGADSDGLPAPDNASDRRYDPVASEADYRRAVLALLTEIRDILLAGYPDE